MSSCAEKVRSQAGKMTDDGFIIFLVCRDHGEMLLDQGWMVGDYNGEEAICQAEKLYEQLQIELPVIEKKKYPGRPAGAKNLRAKGDPLIFCNDRYPELRVIIPSWIGKAEVEQVNFRGGRLNLGSWKEWHNLTDEQVAEAEKILLEKEWVYREYPKPDEEIKCKRCGEVFYSGKDFRMHEHVAHGEILNSVPANSGIGGR